MPTSALSALAIAEQEKPKDDRYEADLKQFIDLYRRVEVWAQKGCIKSIGLCDVELATLSGLYDAVQVKPKSVTVSWPLSRSPNLFIHDIRLIPYFLLV